MRAESELVTRLLASDLGEIQTRDVKVTSPILYHLTDTSVVMQSTLLVSLLISFFYQRGSIASYASSSIARVQNKNVRPSVTLWYILYQNELS